jgi:hypothetical protein
MEYDREKVDEMVLALLWLTLAGDGRAWKGHDWDALERLQSAVTSPIRRAKRSPSSCPRRANGGRGSCSRVTSAARWSRHHP